MADTPHEEILDAVEAAIQALELNGLQNKVLRGLSLTSIVARTSLPCIVIAPVGIESEVGTMTGSDDYSYPVTVRIIDRETDDHAAKIPRYMAWRKKIRDRFHNRRDGLSATGLMWGRFQASPFLEEKPLEYQIISIPLVFAFGVREVNR